MKKKSLIIIPIIIIVVFIIVLLPKNNSINMEETLQDAVETSEVSEPEPEKTPEPQPKSQQKQAKISGHEVQETTKPEQTTEVETEDSTLNSTHTDITLGEDEYQGDNVDIDTGLTEEEEATLDDILDAEIDKILEEYYNSTPTPQQPTYEQVGTPDNTENTRQIQFGSATSDVAPGTVY